MPEGTYLTDYLTDRAVDLIRTHSDDRPFFLNIWYYSVHTPIQAKLEKIAKYEAKRLATAEGLPTCNAPLAEGGTRGSSVRAGDYRLIEFFEDHHVELYNLREDISEQRDLARECGGEDSTAE